jgi:arylformamidase
MMPGEARSYYDISPEISEKLAVFPGDTPFSRKVTVDFGGGINYLASSIHGTVHLGAHVDAPNHYHAGASGIEARSLDYYLGECQVITVQLARGARIQKADVASVAIRAKRILFKTGSFPKPESWNADFNSLSPGLVRWLSEQGVILVGIDTPSIDPCDDKVLETHHAVYEKDMAVLEGVVLDAVPDGVYTLIALPLKIRSADASPVRAVLVRDGALGAGGLR